MEVGLDPPKAPFNASLPIGIAALVRGPCEAVALAERLHLGHRHHVFARAAQHDDVGVVDHAALAGGAEVNERVVQERLAHEARETRIVLEVEHRNPSTSGV